MDFKLKHLLVSFLAGAALLFVLDIVVRTVGLPDIPYRFTLYGAVLEETLKFVSIVGLVHLFKIKPLETLAFGMGFGFAEGPSHFFYPNGNAGIIAFFMHSIVGFVISFFSFIIVSYFSVSFSCLE